ncbi:unnamed protein product [Caenorhabditis nigoni]
MVLIYAVNFYILILVLIPSTPTANGQDVAPNSLWCVEGDKKVFSPVQCPAETTECFKFTCNGIEEPFVARGCGLSVLRSAAGLPNESCHQAQSICEQVGGVSSCHTCNNKHMCNGTFPNFSVIIVLLLSVLLVYVRFI